MKKIGIQYKKKNKEFKNKKFNRKTNKQIDNSKP